MSREESHDLIRQGLQEVAPLKFEIGYNEIDTVIETALADGDLRSKFSSEMGGAANITFPTLQELYVIIQILYTSIKIWKECKSKPTEDEFLRLTKEKATPKQNGASNFTEICSKIYAWLSQTLT